MGALLSLASSLQLPTQMLFDQFCGVAERQLLPENLNKITFRLAQEAKLFVLEGDAKEILPKSVMLLKEAGDAFFLPFDTIAVEDPTSCVIVANLTPNALGLAAERLTLEIRSIQTEGVDEVATFFQCDRSVLRDAILLTLGSIREIASENERLSYRYQLDDVLVVSKHRGPIRRMSDCIVDVDPRVASQNAITAIEQVAWINNPEFFIFERSIADSRHAKVAKGRIPRSDVRPTYRVLHRTKIRQLLRLEESEGVSESHLMPHPRRAHRRVLRSERFAASGKQGTQVVVRSTWVGPSEAIDGRFRYKVLTEM